MTVLDNNTTTNNNNNTVFILSHLHIIITYVNFQYWNFEVPNTKEIPNWSRRTG